MQYWSFIHKVPKFAGKMLAIVTMLLATNCAGPRDQQNTTFTVSILPLKFIVTAITGDDFSVNVLAPAGASPETYEPTPAQMIAVERSEALFVTGLIDFERSLCNKISSQNSHTKAVDLSVGVDLIQGDCAHGQAAAAGQNHHHGVDPHIWASPRNLKIMAGTVFRYISTFYPDSTRYRDNHEALTAQLDTLDRQIANKLNNCRTNTFIIYHPALSYYARDYRLQQVALEREGKEPSADRIRQIIEMAHREGITEVLYQREFSPTSVETVARAIGGRAVEIDPLGGDVIDNLCNITAAICRQQQQP